jgi:hypothetical protein
MSLSLKDSSMGAERPVLLTTLLLFLQDGTLMLMFQALLLSAVAVPLCSRKAVTNVQKIMESIWSKTHLELTVSYFITCSSIPGQAGSQTVTRRKSERQRCLHKGKENDKGVTMKERGQHNLGT